MRIVSADYLRDFSQDEIWGLPMEKFQIECVDGTVNANTAHLQFSWCLWGPLRMYGLPVLKEFVLAEMLSDKVYMSLQSKIHDYTVRYLCDNGRDEEVWDSCKELYCGLNRIYNAVDERLLAYSMVSDFIHLAECCEEPDIKAAKLRYRSNEEPNIEVLYGITMERMANSPYLKKNAFAIGTQAGALDRKSVQQLVAGRGNTMDVSGEAFPYPIHNSYTEGLNSYYDSLTESRGVPIALSAQGDDLRRAEYSSRRLQLALAVIGKVTLTDCQTNNLLYFTPDESDYRLFIGAYVVNADGSKTEIMKRNAKSFIGKQIGIRNIAMCGELHKGHVCKVCLGAVSRVLLSGANVGITITTPILKRITQSLLGLKHLLQSGVADTIEIPVEMTTYLNTDKDNPWSIKLCKASVKKYLLIPSNELRNINQINTVSDITRLLPERVSRIRRLGLFNKKNTENGHEWDQVAFLKTENNNVGSSLTHEFLKYMAGRFTYEDDFVVVDLAEWDITKPFLQVPKLRADTKTLLRELSRFFFSNNVEFSDDNEDDNNDDCVEDKTNSYLTQCKHVEPAILQLYDILAPRIDGTDERAISEDNDFNIAQLTVMVACCMARDTLNNDYRLPKSGESFRFIAINTSAITERSISAYLAYQGQKQLFLTPHAYLNNKRQPHGYDELIKP